MDNSWLDFQNGNINAIKVEAIISKEINSKGMEFIHILIDGNEVYNFWRNPANAKQNVKPKHSGGKRPYIMLMIDKLEELREKKIKNIEELIGFLVCLGGNIEWHTGKLVHKRSKRALKYTDLQVMFNYGNRKLNRIISDLKKYELLTGNQEGYFIADSLIKKGSKQKEKPPDITGG